MTGCSGIAVLKADWAIPSSLTSISLFEFEASVLAVLRLGLRFVNCVESIFSLSEVDVMGISQVTTVIDEQSRISFQS